MSTLEKVIKLSIYNEKHKKIQEQISLLIKTMKYHLKYPNELKKKIIENSVRGRVSYTIRSRSFFFSSNNELIHFTTDISKEPEWSQVESLMSQIIQKQHSETLRLICIKCNDYKCKNGYGYCSYYIIKYVWDIKS